MSMMAWGVLGETHPGPRIKYGAGPTGHPSREGMGKDKKKRHGPKPLPLGVSAVLWGKPGRALTALQERADAGALLALLGPLHPGEFHLLADTRPNISQGLTLCDH